MQNKESGVYYVLDNAFAQAVPLIDWVNNIKTRYPSMSLTFNVCTYYGSAPQDTCSTAAYQKEIRDAFFESNRMVEASTRLQTPVSAKRALNENWSTNYPRLGFSKSNKASIYEQATKWTGSLSEDNLTKIPSWPNARIIQENFESIRDSRYFLDQDKDNFLRRISWLYPDDGCWTRASAIIKDFFGPFNNLNNKYKRPAKIFVFGNLCVNTDNSSRGYVAWWYHTAPVIKDEQTKQVYVLDPSVDAHSPLLLETWAGLISSNKGACQNNMHGEIERVSICNGYGSGPGDVCDAKEISEVSNILLQSKYQHYERNRQTQLSRDADLVLGESPPWKNKPASKSS